MLYILGLWLISDFNKCSDLDDRKITAEREKVVSFIFAACFSHFYNLGIRFVCSVTATDSEC